MVKRGQQMKAFASATVLAASIALVGCGGGGGGTVNTIETTPPNNNQGQNLNNQDVTAGTYLENVDLTVNQNDTSGSNRLMVSTTALVTEGVSEALAAAGVTEAQANAALQGGAVTDIWIEIAGERVTTTSSIADLRNQAISRLNSEGSRIISTVNGVSEAHAAGWTGLGIRVAVVDGGEHGEEVSLITGAIAPGADIEFVRRAIHENGWYDEIADIRNADVINLSIGGGNFRRDNDELLRDTHVTVFAAQHSNWGSSTINGVARQGSHGDTQTRAACVNDGAMEVANCHTWAVHDVRFLTDDNVIFAGEVESVNGQFRTPVWSNVSGGVENFVVTDSSGLGGQAGRAQGNSFAAPRVSGVAALIRHKFGNVSAAETVDIIVNTADEFNGYNPALHGAGMLDAAGALSPIGELQ